MTVFQYIDEVMLRLRTFETLPEVDGLQILSYLNSARKKIEYDTIAYYPERYSVINSFAFSPVDDLYNPYSLDNTVAANRQNSDIYRILLPVNFLDAIVVKLVYVDDEDTQYEFEARRMTKYEMFSVAQHKFNRPTYTNPCYSIAREGGSYYLYYSSLKNGDDLITETPTLEVWHTCVISDLEWLSGNDTIEGDTEVVIAKELEELVILYTIFLYLQQINNQIYLNLISLEIQNMLNTLQPIYQLQKLNQEVELASQEGE